MNENVKFQRILRSKQKVIGVLRGKTVTILVSVLMVFLAISVLGFLLFRQKDVLLSYHWKLNWIPFLGAFAVHAVSLFGAAVVWAGIIDTLGPKLSFKQHFRFFCMNMIARRIPGTVWHVVYRAQAYNRFGLNVQLTTLSSGVEMAISLISGVITIFFFAVPILEKLNLSLWLFFVLLIVGITFINPISLKWLLKKMSVDPSKIRNRDLIRWIVIYVLLWIGGGSVTFLLINVLYKIPLQQLGFVIGCWALVGTASQALVLLPSNFGFNEVTLSLLLSQLMPSSLAVVVAISPRIVLTFFEIFWSVISLLLLKDSK